MVKATIQPGSPCGSSGKQTFTVTPSSHSSNGIFFETPNKKRKAERAAKEEEVQYEEMHGATPPPKAIEIAWISRLV